MKQLIVLVASVVLGVGIGGIVLGFGDTADSLNTTATGGLTSMSAIMYDEMNDRLK